VERDPEQHPEPCRNADPGSYEDPTRWQLGLRVLAMPADTNPYGDIFGGWMLSQADIAGATVAVALAQGRVATVAVQEFRFLAPVRVGDLVELFARVVRVGSSSMTVEVSAWARREALPRQGHEVAAGRMVYVAVDAKGRSRPIDNAPINHQGSLAGLRTGPRRVSTRGV
jgi:acyl-CoA thioesterase YciA